jgi:RNA polymerase sigma-70 factor (ECF subfamily)
VDAFIKALRGGDFDGLVAVLDPDAVVRVDEFGARPGEPREIHGAQNWVRGAIAFARAARFMRTALVNGQVGLVLAPHGRLTRALSFTIEHGKITEVDVVADPARLRRLDLAALDR